MSNSASDHLSPLVSAIIPNFNGESLLTRCVKSLLAQTYGSLELIFVDNGSIDGSRELIGRLAPSARVLMLDRNYGFAYAVNTGVARSNGDLMFLVNNDTVCEPECVETLVNAACRMPSYGSFSPRIVRMENPDDSYAVGLMYSHRGYGNRSNVKVVEDLHTERDVFGFCGAAAMLRKSSFLDTGPLNERFFFLHEDVEMSFRLQLRGHKCRYIPQAVVRHAGSATLRQFVDRAVTETVKNSVFTFATCAPRAYVVRHCRSIVSFHSRLWWCLALRGYGSAVVKAWAWLAIHFATVIRRRRWIQGRATLSSQALESILYRGPVHVNLPTGVVSFE